MQEANLKGSHPWFCWPGASSSPLDRALFAELLCQSIQCGTVYAFSQHMATGATTVPACITLLQLRRCHTLRRRSAQDRWDFHTSHASQGTHKMASLSGKMAAAVSSLPFCSALAPHIVVFFTQLRQIEVDRSVEGRNWPISEWATVNAPKSTKNTERFKSTERIRNAPKNPAKA